jgi:hypothetical protein
MTQGIESGQAMGQHPTSGDTVSSGRDRRPVILGLEDQARVDTILEFLRYPPLYESGSVYEFCWADCYLDRIEVVAQNRAANLDEDRRRFECRPRIRMDLKDLKFARSQLKTNSEDATDTIAMKRASSLIGEAIRTARVIKRKQRMGLWDGDE